MDLDRPKVLIANTDISDDTGTHYFTVAFFTLAAKGVTGLICRTLLVVL